MPKSIKKSNKFLLALGVLFFSLFFLSLKKEAYALTQPTRVELEGEPGQVLSGTLELYNEQEREITFYLSYQNFEARGETGSPSFLEYDNTGLASWIKTAESATLQPKERVEFPYEIQIPQGTEAGTYLAAVFFGNTPAEADQAGQVTIGTKLGTLMFLTLPGAKVEGAGVIEYGTKDGKGFFAHIPVDLFYRFSNDGAVKIMPSGNIEIKSMFGKNVANLDANASRGNILPNSIRRFEIVWNEIGQDNVTKKDQKKDSVKLPENGKVGFFDAVKIQLKNFAIGKYTANLKLTYGEEQKTENKQASFWIIPWQLLVLVIGGLLLIIIIIKTIMKRHNKKLIEKVKRETLAAQKVTITSTETIKADPVEKEKVEEAEEPKEVEEKTEETAVEENGPTPINPAQ